MLIRMVVQGVVAILYTAEIAVLLCVTHPKYKDRCYVPVKMMCSVSFVGISVMYAIVSKHWAYFYLLMCPLLLCAFGDLFMGFYQVRRKKRHMLFGMVFFLLAHLGLLRMLFALDKRLGVWNLLVPAAALAVFFVLKKVFHLHPGRLLVPVCIYAVFLALMLSKSLEQMILHPGIASAWIGVGGLLFFLSDLTIIFLYFYKFRQKSSRRVCHYVNLTTYYFAILAFDTSILYMIYVP